MAKPISFSKRMGYFLEALLLRLIFGLFRLLPLDKASKIGGKLAQFIGPKLKWQKVATYNMRLAFPDWNEEKRTQILHKMWDNLGRTFAETPWLGHAEFCERIEIDITAKARISEYSKADRPCIFIGAHLANWEVVPLVGGMENTPITSIYRHLNNPYVDKIYYDIRSRYCSSLEPKGKSGARALLRTMRNNGQAGLLIDQKQNDGERIEFFGRAAPTSTAAAEMAVKFGARLSPIRCIRTKGCNFKIEVSELNIPKDIDAIELMHLLNEQVEEWVLEHPEQWLWVHQRWGKLSELPPLD